LVNYALKLTRLLNTSFNELDIYIRSDPAYGGCDIGYLHALTVGANTIIHVGHEDYPLKEVKPLNGIDVIHVKALHTIHQDTINKILDCLYKVANTSKMLLFYSLTEELYVKQIVKSIGVHWTIKILGCYIPCSRSELINIDTAVVVSGGYFHVLGVGLHLASIDLENLKNVRILLVDPYTGKVLDMNDYILRVLKTRIAYIYEASNAHSVGIIAGLRYYQYRPLTISRLVNIFKKHGIRYDIHLMYDVTKENLDNIQNHYDVFVVTSCPRVAVDDLSNYHIPVLTPGEMICALNDKCQYRFVW